MLEAVKENDKRLPELAAEQIRDLIAGGGLKVGEKLPNEFELAQQLQVGRGTIREAVKILVSRNVLEIRRGLGTFVSEHTGMSEDPLGLWFIEDKKKLARDLCEVRLMLEPEIARLAAERADLQGIARLREAQAAVEEKIEAGEDHSCQDIRFHEVIAQLAQNQVVSKLVPVIQQAVGLFVQITAGSLSRQTLDTHRELVKAIAAGDADQAESWMRRHLLLNRDEINRLIAQD